LSRLSPSVTAAAHVASPSSTAATPPQFLAAQKASAVIDASRRALLENEGPLSAVANSNIASDRANESADVANIQSARLQDALGRGGGGGQDGGVGAVTQEQLRAAYSMQMVCRQRMPVRRINRLPASQQFNSVLQNGHSSRTASDNAHIGKHKHLSPVPAFYANDSIAVFNHYGIDTTKRATVTLTEQRPP
jgi:hypothetical protein